MEPSSNNQSNMSTFEVEPPTDPGTQPATRSALPSSMITKTKKPRKKGRIVAIISLAALVVLVGGGYAAYALWYQNPDRVIASAMMNAMTADSMIADTAMIYTQKQTGDSFNITVNTQSDGKNASATVDLRVKSAGEDLDISSSVINIADGDSLDTYLKIDGIKSLIDVVSPNYNEFAETYDDIALAFDNQWVKASTDDLNGDIAAFSGDTVASGVDQQCVVDLTNKIHSDKSYQKEIADLYLDNAFIEVVDTLGSSNGNLGYTVQFSREKAISFVEDLRSTKTYTGYRDCMTGDTRASFDEGINDLLVDLKEAKSPTDDVKIELWIDQWSHQLKQANARITDTDGNTTVIDSDVQFNTDVSIQAPSDAKTIRDVYQEIMAVYVSNLSSTSAQ